MTSAKDRRRSSLGGQHPASGATPHDPREDQQTQQPEGYKALEWQFVGAGVLTGIATGMIIGVLLDTGELISSAELIAHAAVGSLGGGILGLAACRAINGPIQLD